jgi:GH25 family lysozyme M1 (1,4-beta-N-acetylmuramidase)
LCCDFEGKSYANVEQASLLAHGLEWLERFYAALENAIGQCGRMVIYTGARHWNSIGNPEWARAASLDLWVARYNDACEPPVRLPRPWATWSIWQFTDGNDGPHLDVPGVGMCDCSVLASQL